MAKKRRTRAQKAAAHQRLTTLVTVSLPQRGIAVPMTARNAEEAQTIERITDRFVHELFPYRLSLIYQDLLKTILVTGGMVALLVGLGIVMK